jgi:SAM-dependent methyltransferase
VRDAQYWRCPICKLTFLDPAHYLSPTAEKQHYLTHENDPYDAGYRRWLLPLLEALLERLPPPNRKTVAGLDFGAGPGPALAQMLREEGYSMRVYDPFFAPDEEVLQDQYDFIVCSETAEHFHNPGEEFSRMDRLLKPGRWLGIMTQLLDDDGRFAAWWYVRDPTHVAFYRRETMAWLAANFGWRLDIPRKNVVLFRKAGA